MADPRSATSGQSDAQPDEMHEPSVAVATRQIGFEPPRGVTRIEWRPGVAHIALKTEAGRRDLASVFRSLAAARVSVDMIKLLPPGICFSLSQDQVDAAAEALQQLGLEFRVTRDCAVLTVFAPDMRSIPGIMATVVGALDNSGVRAHFTDDSYNSIFCVIDRQDGPKACKALAGEFGLDVQTRAGPTVEW